MLVKIGQIHFKIKDAGGWSLCMRTNKKHTHTYTQIQFLRNTIILNCQLPLKDLVCHTFLQTKALRNENYLYFIFQHTELKV